MYFSDRKVVAKDAISEVNYGRLEMNYLCLEVSYWYLERKKYDKEA